MTYSGFFEGYHHLSNEKRWKLMELCNRKGVPPSYESVEKIIHHPKFSFVRDIQIKEAKWISSTVWLETSKGALFYDYLILATGFEIDVSNQPELKSFSDKIQLWSDRKSTQNLQGPKRFYRSPYLGAHFQFLEKNPGEAPYLKDIYCFNHAATLSHGLVSSDIPGISVGASRLARGITADLFGENWDAYYRRLDAYQTPELLPHLR